MLSPTAPLKSATLFFFNFRSYYDTRLLLWLFFKLKFSRFFFLLRKFALLHLSRSRIFVRGDAATALFPEILWPLDFGLICMGLKHYWAHTRCWPTRSFSLWAYSGYTLYIFFDPKFKSTKLGSNFLIWTHQRFKIPRMIYVTFLK